MPKQLWTSESEACLMREWHEVLLSSQGEMLTQKEKIEVVRKKLCEVGVKEGWEVIFSSDQVQHKLEALSKKAKKIYGKFTKQTATGSAVEDRFNL